MKNIIFIVVFSSAFMMLCFKMKSLDVVALTCLSFSSMYAHKNTQKKQAEDAEKRAAAAHAFLPPCLLDGAYHATKGLVGLRWLRLVVGSLLATTPLAWSAKRLLLGRTVLQQTPAARPAKLGCPHVPWRCRSPVKASTSPQP